MHAVRAIRPPPLRGRSRATCPFLVLALWGFAGAPTAAESGPTARSIRERGHMVACVPDVAMGAADRHPRTGQWSGPDVEMMELLALRLRGSVRWRPVSTSELPTALAEGRCDLGVGGWTSAMAQGAGLPTTRALRQVDACAVVARRPGPARRWPELIASAHRAAALGVSGFAPALRASMRHGQVIESDALPVLLRQLHADRIEAVVMDRARAERVAGDDPAVTLACPPEPFQVQTLAYVLPRGDEAWWRTVDDFVRRAQEDGTLARLAERHAPRRPGARP